METAERKQNGPNEMGLDNKAWNSHGKETVWNGSAANMSDAYEYVG